MVVTTQCPYAGSVQLLKFTANNQLLLLLPNLNRALLLTQGKGSMGRNSARGMLPPL
jgi:hypothetical protein